MVDLLLPLSVSEPRPSKLGKLVRRARRTIIYSVLKKSIYSKGGKMSFVRSVSGLAL